MNSDTRGAASQGPKASSYHNIMFAKRIIASSILILTALHSSSARESENTLSSSWVSFRDELTSNYIVSLDTDRYGTIWIGTADGMNSFDGVSVSRYTKNSGALSSNELNAVIADKFSDKIWFASKRNGLGCYNWKTRETTFLKSGGTPDIPSNEITDIFQDKRGDIWFSTYTEGICRYDPNENTLTRFYQKNVSGLQQGYIRKFCISSDGKIYVAFYGEGIAVIDPRNMTAISFVHDAKNPNSLPSNQVGSIYIDKENNVWVGTREGLALLRPVTQDFTVFDKDNSGLPSGLIFSMHLTEDRQLLVSPDMRGLWSMDLNEVGDRHFTKVNSPDLFDDVGIHAMIEDAYGNIWFGTAGKGLIFRSENTSGFATVTYPRVLTERIVRGVCRNDTGELLVATDGGSLNILDDKAVFKTSTEKVLPDRNVQSVYCDSDGNIWTGMFNGKVSVLDSNLNHKFSVSSNEVHTFCESGDTMWVASGISGLYAVDRHTGQRLSYYRSPDYFPDNYLKSLCIDKSGRIWVGTFRSGLFVFDHNMNRLASFSTADGFPSNSINHIVQDSRGSIWVATGEGLVHFPESGDRLFYDRVYNEDDHLDSEIIMAVLEDSDGDIWFSTTSSIARLKNGHIAYYTTNVAGMTNGNFSAGAATQWTEDILAFGSSDGVVFIDKRRLYATADKIPLHFAKIRASDRRETNIERFDGFPLVGSNEVHLKYWQNSFSISFAADNFALHNSLEYSYRIAGLNNNWYHTDGTELSFFRLRPGRYTLQICARRLNEEWTGEDATLRIIITPPFYATLVAKLFYILSILSLLIWSIYVYIGKTVDKAAISSIKEMNEEKLRFYTNVTHELKTPITLILGPAEDIMNDSSLSSGSRKKAELVYRNAQHLLDLINKLLNFRKAETGNVSYNPTYGDLSSFVKDIGTIFAESNTNKNLKFNFRIEDGISLDFDKEIITSILNNLLSNAVKYTARGTVTIGLHSENDDAVISIADTGTGIAAEQLSKIFDRFYRVPGKENIQGNGIGLSIVKRLVEVHHGSISAESKNGNGSTFTVRIPISAASAAEEAHSKGEIDSGTKPRIVIAEDNQDIRDYLSETLADEYDVFCAADGESGLEQAIRHCPDLIISDIMMPRMDGLEFCRRVKKDIRLSHIPVILLTAKDTMDDKSSGYKAGADSYITKPFTRDIICTRISNLLESRRKLADAYLSSVGSNEKRIEPTANVFSPLDNNFMKKLTAYIEDNLASESLDMENLASNMNVSVSSLYRKVKSLIGISANDYIRKIKMKKAAEMLISGNFNVSETAWNVGISSLAYFRQCFKEEYGCTPSEYRKNTETQ